MAAKFLKTWQPFSENIILGCQAINCSPWQDCTPGPGKDGNRRAGMDLDSPKRAGIVGMDPGKGGNRRAGMGKHFQKGRE